MNLTKEQVHKDLNTLPEHYKTRDVDRLIRGYVKQKADASLHTHGAAVPQDLLLCDTGSDQERGSAHGLHP